MSTTARKKTATKKVAPPKQMTKAQIQAALYKIGFDNAYTSYSTAVKGFQFGFALGGRLSVDGIAGPKTQAAILKSLSRAQRGLGTAGWHFSYSEFRCKCGGKQPGCKRIWIARDQLLRLHTYRNKVGRPVRVISGYRCPGHNAAVGGARNSQHLYGYSTDFVGLVPASTLVSWKIFAGVGRGGITGRAVHGDSRDKSPYNTTGGRTWAPTQWRYNWG